jgi:phosphoglycerol transferase
LKLRHLISPLPDHWFAPFRRVEQMTMAARFPNENENQTARLGLVGSIGVIALIGVLMVPALAGRGEHRHMILSAARLTLAAVLLASIGGIGSLFSVLVSSDIRAYNRIAPFIGFLAMVGVAGWVDQATVRRAAWRRAAWAAILTIGILDQIVPLLALKRVGPTVEAEVRRVQSLAGSLESQLTAGAAVFQLPIRPFPLDPGIQKMGLYDHFKPYIASHSLRWSYPSMSRTQVRWERRIAAIPLQELPRRLANEGFSAILLDRRGYTESEAADVIAALATGGAEAPLAENGNYLALDLRRLSPGRER